MLTIALEIVLAYFGHGFAFQVERRMTGRVDTESRIRSEPSGQPSQMAVTRQRIFGKLQDAEFLESIEEIPGNIRRGVNEIPVPGEVLSAPRIRRSYFPQQCESLISGAIATPIPKALSRNGLQRKLFYAAHGWIGR